MNELLISVIVVLIAVIIALAAAIIIKNRRLSALKRSIDGFMRGGEPILSLKDDKLSQLENSVGELENALLQKANTENAVSENERFVADISHQLKTPLAGLRLYCELDRAEAPNSRNEKQLELISKTERLIHELLRMEKLRSDSYQLEMKSEDLASIVNENAEYFRKLPRQSDNRHGRGSIAVRRSVARRSDRQRNKEFLRAHVQRWAYQYSRRAERALGADSF